MILINLQHSFFLWMLLLMIFSKNLLAQPIDSSIKDKLPVYVSPHYKIKYNFDPAPIPSDPSLLGKINPEVLNYRSDPTTPLEHWLLKNYQESYFKIKEAAGLATEGLATKNARLIQLYRIIKRTLYGDQYFPPELTVKEANSSKFLDPVVLAIASQELSNIEISIETLIKKLKALLGLLDKNTPITFAETVKITSLQVRSEILPSFNELQNPNRLPTLFERIMRELHRGHWKISNKKHTYLYEWISFLLDIPLEKALSMKFEDLIKQLETQMSHLFWELTFFDPIKKPDHLLSIDKIQLLRRWFIAHATNIYLMKKANGDAVVPAHKFPNLYDQTEKTHFSFQPILEFYSYDQNSDLNTARHLIEILKGSYHPYAEYFELAKRDLPHLSLFLQQDYQLRLTIRTLPANSAIKSSGLCLTVYKK